MSWFSAYCIEVMVHQILIGGLQFINCQIKHSHLLHMFCNPAVDGYHAVSVILLLCVKKRIIFPMLFKKALRILLSPPSVHLSEPTNGHILGRHELGTCHLFS